MASRCMDRSSSTAAILPRRVPANTARPDGSAHRAVTGEPSATVCVVGLDPWALTVRRQVSTPTPGRVVNEVAPARAQRDWEYTPPNTIRRVA